MDFIIIFAAMAANVITARIFKPYTHWIIAIFNDISEYFGKKTYKKASRIGAFITIVSAVLIWLTSDLLIAALSSGSYIYRYIIYALTVYFTVCIGQTVGVLSELSKNVSNAEHTESLMKEFFVTGFKKRDEMNQKRLIVRALARVLAEKIVMPLLLIVIFGPPVTLVYAFVNTLARSDMSENVKRHGFADLAVKLNNIVSVPAYEVLSLALFAANWVLSVKSDCKGLKLYEKCEKRLLSFDKDRALTKTYVTILKSIIIGMAFVLFIALLCAYIFVQAVFAGMGLDDYIDNWNKGASE